MTYYDYAGPNNQGAYRTRNTAIPAGPGDYFNVPTRNGYFNSSDVYTHERDAYSANDNLTPEWRTNSPLLNGYASRPTTPHYGYGFAGYNTRVPVPKFVELVSSLVLREGDNAKRYFPFPRAMSSECVAGESTGNGIPCDKVKFTPYLYDQDVDRLYGPGVTYRVNRAPPTLTMAVYRYPDKDKSNYILSGIQALGGYQTVKDLAHYGLPGVMVNSEDAAFPLSYENGANFPSSRPWFRTRKEVIKGVFKALEERPIEHEAEKSYKMRKVAAELFHQSANPESVLSSGLLCSALGGVADCMATVPITPRALDFCYSAPEIERMTKGPYVERAKNDVVIVRDPSRYKNVAKSPEAVENMLTFLSGGALYMSSLIKRRTPAVHDNPAAPDRWTHTLGKAEAVTAVSLLVDSASQVLNMALEALVMKHNSDYKARFADVRSRGYEETDSAADLDKFKKDDLNSTNHALASFSTDLTTVVTESLTLLANGFDLNFQELAGAVTQAAYRNSLFTAFLLNALSSKYAVPNSVLDQIHPRRCDFGPGSEADVAFGARIAMDKLPSYIKQGLRINENCRNFQSTTGRLACSTRDSRAIQPTILDKATGRRVLNPSILAVEICGRPVSSCHYFDSVSSAVNSCDLGRWSNVYKVLGCERFYGPAAGQVHWNKPLSISAPPVALVPDTKFQRNFHRAYKGAGVHHGASRKFEAPVLERNVPSPNLEAGFLRGEAPDLALGTDARSFAKRGGFGEVRTEMPPRGTGFVPGHGRPVGIASFVREESPFYGNQPNNAFQRAHERFGNSRVAAFSDVASEDSTLDLRQNNRYRPFAQLRSATQQNGR